MMNRILNKKANASNALERGILHLMMSSRQNSSGLSMIQLIITIRFLKIKRLKIYGIF
jgi:hypothetical protein